jgi:hypothetical protein
MLKQEAGERWITVRCTRLPGIFNGHEDSVIKSTKQHMKTCETKNGPCTNECQLKRFSEQRTLSDPFVI